MSRLSAILIMITACLAITGGASIVDAGPLEQLSHGGRAGDRPSEHAFRGLWSPDPESAVYPADKNVQTLFRVRYYRQEWKFKKYETFTNFPEAKYFLLKKKMEGYTANLSIHEIAKRPRKGDYWLP